MPARPAGLEAEDGDVGRTHRAAMKGRQPGPTTGSQTRAPPRRTGFPGESGRLAQAADTRRVWTLRTPHGPLTQLQAFTQPTPQQKLEEDKGD